MNEKPIRKQKDAPGFMLYTVSRSLFEALEPVTVKRLLLAMMDYAAEGKEPELTNTEERIAWAALRDKIRSDQRRYEQKCLQNQYNRFLREAERRMPREDCPDYEEWLELSEQGARKFADTLALLYERNDFLRTLPNTNTNTKTKTKTEINLKTKSIADPVSEAEAGSKAEGAFADRNRPTGTYPPLKPYF